MLSSPTKGNGQTTRPVTMMHFEKRSPPRLRVDEAARHSMIARAAFLAAERRGFKGGSAGEDWLAAEIEIDKRIGPGSKG